MIMVDIAIIEQTETNKIIMTSWEVINVLKDEY